MTWLTNLYNRFLAWQRAGRIRREAVETRRPSAYYVEGRLYGYAHGRILTDQDGDTLIGHKADIPLKVVSPSLLPEYGSDEWDRAKARGDEIIRRESWPEILED